MNLALKRLFSFSTFGSTGDYSIKPSLRKIINLGIVATTLLAICVLVFFKDNRSYALFTIISVITAYFICGSILGFIFAVPKSFQSNTAASTDTDGNNGRTSYKDNTSLEEISDWLTKIIIGITLTQFTQLQKMIYEASKYISEALTTANDTDGSVFTRYLPFSYALIILYSAIGMICGYLWTRIEFPKILRKKDHDVEKQIEVSRSIVRSLNNPNDGQIGTAGLVQTHLSNDASQIELMNSILRSKGAGPDPDDPQKGRWGGKSITENREISAEVSTSMIPGLYKVKIKVSSVDRSPISGPVAIVLHDSFEPMMRVLDPQGESDVFVEVIAYEAFTVGALSDVQSEKIFTQLELDINDLPNLPQGFYWNK